MSTEDENDTKLDEKDEIPENEVSPEITEPEKVTIQHMEQIEEAKLKAKYPAALKPGGTAFLQKRLNKGQKYFDSGDYNMAKAKGQKRIVPTAATAAAATTTTAASAAIPQAITPQTTTGDAIPTPDNLPTRKTSLVQSKLAAGFT